MRISARALESSATWSPVQWKCESAVFGASAAALVRGVVSKPRPIAHRHEVRGSLSYPPQIRNLAAALSSFCGRLAAKTSVKFSKFSPKWRPDLGPPVMLSLESFRRKIHFYKGSLPRFPSPQLERRAGAYRKRSCVPRGDSLRPLFPISRCMSESR